MAVELSAPRAGLRRAFIFGLSFISTALATAVWADLLSQNGTTIFDIIQIALFVPGVLWVSVFFWSSLMGWLRLMVNGRVPGLLYPETLSEGAPAPELFGQGNSPIAIVVPIRNEDVAAVFARIMAMDTELERAGNKEAFHFFVLSDTNEADTLLEEEWLWHKTMQKLKAEGRLFYRRRPRNPGRKAGNLADFCTRWGAHYSHMIVLDADSLLTANALITLARMGRLNPTAGIIQALPSIVNAKSFYARAQQFAARLYGPMLASGLSYWHLGDGNYWGHNAIINVRFFTESCGLPTLAGGPPFGGHILSHDFVEAALIRRSGWKVWLLPELGGSFEQMPANIIENSKRERRWMQGNFQHYRLLLVSGLHPLSRTHLLMGITSYLMPMAALLFMFTGLASAIYSNMVPPSYFGADRALFPNWPIFDGNRALSLLAAIIVTLTLPKILAVIWLWCYGRLAKTWGGRLRVLVNMLVEHAFTILLAPIMMLVQSGFALEIFRGKDSGWGAQNRGDADMSWQEGWQRHKAHTAIGVGLAVISHYFAPSLFWWLSPVFSGLIVSIPLSVWSARASIGLKAKRLGLFLIPEETTIPAVCQLEAKFEPELAALLPKRDHQALGALENLFTSPELGALHLSLLPDNPLTYVDLDELAKARRKVAFRLRGESAQMPALSATEKLALLYDEETLSRLPLGIAPVLP